MGELDLGRLAKMESEAEANLEVWHKCPSPILPRRTVDGGWTSFFGQTWRRRVAGKWQYQQDPETEEEFWDQVW